MRSIECPHEAAVVDAVLSGSWPYSSDDALVAHAAECTACGETASVAVLLRDDGDRSRIEVRVPAAGQIWWRSAVRARLESTQAATRPMAWMHGITAAAVLGVFLAALTAAWPRLWSLAETLRATTAELLPSTEVTAAIADGLRLSALLGLVAAALMIVAPLAIYYALSDE